MVEADAGYGGPYVRKPTDYVSAADWKAKTVARSRHESINGHFKRWSILKNRYCHDINEHYIVFQAVVVLTQMSIDELFYLPFEVTY